MRGRIEIPILIGIIVPFVLGGLVVVPLWLFGLPKPPTPQEQITTLSARQSLQEERMLSMVNGTCEGYNCHNVEGGE
jgi:hypothetical protein